ncbi:MAG: carbamoyltransferase C-terminal domain-containing protein, partial [Elusimicrobiota bacterium]|nr:carbamoyltransferase C-terminal domain-containing protein [Elusimicrobiota bacterium]
GKLLKSGIFENIWIQPAAGDAGGALGAAFLAHHMYFNEKRLFSKNCDKMRGSYLGPEFSDADIKSLAKTRNVKYEYFKNFNDLADAAAQLISEGHILGWFQGRMEWGPRALGNRSIIADARDKGIQKRLNLNIKFRESFRPFAPSILGEDAKDFFDIQVSSPYMLMTAAVLKDKRKELPSGYNGFDMKKKLGFIRSDVPGITHVDFSARVQTVSKTINERYWTLIDLFKQKTKCPMIINTSFNVADEPIVSSPEEAFRCFLKTKMDYLVMGNFLFRKGSASGNN